MIRHHSNYVKIQSYLSKALLICMLNLVVLLVILLKTPFNNFLWVPLSLSIKFLAVFFVTSTKHCLAFFSVPSLKHYYH